MASQTVEAHTIAITPVPTVTGGGDNPSSVTQQGQQIETLEQGDSNDVEDINYPKGMKLWLTMISLCFMFLLTGLDLTIVAVAIPSLTDQFKTISDIGWYSAAYFGKVYTVFPLKTVFITGIVVFEIGSLICTVAANSPTFILGRAITGLGSSIFNAGIGKVLRHCFPLSNLAIANGLVGASQAIGLVSAPAVGGVLIDAFSWRACFGINLPLGVLCIILTAYGFSDPIPNPETALPLKEKLARLDFFGTILVVPSIASLMMALQWGGNKYGWGDARIIVLLVVFAILFAAFGYIQHRQGEVATIPLRVVKNRSIVAATWYSACCNGVLAMTEYYISIYFQGVRGFTPTKSGLLGLPMIGGLAVSMGVAAAGTAKIGYYVPFMFATTVLAPVASGLLTTLDLDGSIIKPAALLAFLGFAIGLGQQAPQLAVQAVLPISDVSIGGALIIFGAGMGSALWICASATLFNARLVSEIQAHSPYTNATALDGVGLSDIRGFIGEERLKAVLVGYNEAVVQTLYMPLALGIATVLGTGAMEWRSIKKKQN
ncbi:hypothetical protein BP6252_13466 [Coleophoma cylindrospora]|uniref:Major facilitator superfamily (MFS) profile domain-containing protein n=1 Tax=Coleophoma cylindrospora TaxID=1849047 RepID=A0A3D8Q892_9HELO|nr:hypothetical protein BP6252_13466 [Coleophoma cylindrospora]